MSSAGPWRYTSASVRGTSHVENGLPCQDSAIIHPFQAASGEAILTLVAADGAGSAIHAAEGARLACSSFVTHAMHFLTQHGDLATLTQPTVEEWIRSIVDTIRLGAYGAAAAPRDFACTLLASIIGVSHAAFAQIGDGAIVISDEDEYRPVFWPQSGMYANTTFFLTDETATKNLQFYLSDGSPDEVALLSDGLQMLALRYATRDAHAPFFRPLFQRLRIEGSGDAHELQAQLSVWLDSPAVNNRTDDDKTLVLATRRSPALLDHTS